MSRTRIIGKVEVKEIEWEIPNFLSRIADAKGCELLSDPFTFAGESYTVVIRGLETDKDYFTVYLYKEECETSCNMQCTLGFKSGGQIQDVIEDLNLWHSKGAIMNYLHILGFWREDLEQRWSVLDPSGALTLVCTLWEGDLAADMAEGSNYTCRTVTQHATHPALLHLLQIGNEVKEVEWNIPEHFLSKTYRECEMCQESDAFPFAGDTWQFKLYHDIGQLFFTQLSRRRAETECSVQCTMGIKKADGRVWTDGKVVNLNFEKGFGLTSPTEFDIKRDVLRQHRSELIHPSGVLTLVVTLRKEDQTTGRTETGIKKLSDDLKDLMVSGEESDFTVKVQGEEFRLHKNILGARTPVFRSMLRSEMKEKTTGCVSIDDCEPEVFRKFVRYVYSGRLDEQSADTVFGLYAIADKYHADDLKSACLGFVKRTISIDTFCEAINLALTHGLKDLLSDATDYFAENTKAIIQTVKWMNFMIENPIQSNELHLKALCKRAENKDA